MPWWQVVFIIIGSIAVGLGAGYVLNKAVVRTFAAPRARPQPLPLPNLPEPEREREIPAAEPAVPDLFTEIEYNRRVASGEWNGEPQPFLTRAWDNRGDELQSLPVDVRAELTEAYSDMALANSITWLSTEMGRRSQSLDESYLKLRSSVAERLNKARPHLAVRGQPAKVASRQ